MQNSPKNMWIISRKFISLFMKPTYEYCSRCKTTTQHLNGDCDCYQPPASQKKVNTVEQLPEITPDERKSIKDLQSIYNKITSYV